jgi:hypothetical protein
MTVALRTLGFAAGDSFGGGCGSAGAEAPHVTGGALLAAATAAFVTAGGAVSAYLPRTTHRRQLAAHLVPAALRCASVVVSASADGAAGTAPAEPRAVRCTLQQAAPPAASGAAGARVSDENDAPAGAGSGAPADGAPFHTEPRRGAPAPAPAARASAHLQALFLDARARATALLLTLRGD